MSKRLSIGQRAAYLWRKLGQWYDLNRRFLGTNVSRYARYAADIDYSTVERTIYEEYSPCFVLSTGRCGTDFLAHVLKASRDLGVYQNPQPEFRFYKKDAYRANPTHSKALEEVIKSSRFEIILGEYQRGRRYVETNNAICFFAPQLAALFPRSIFIHLIRHPGDFARSGMRRGWYTGTVETDIGILRKPDDAEWDSCDRLMKIGWLWNETNSFIRDFSNTIDSDRFLLVRSEDMFRDRGVILRIFSFLGARPPTERTLRRLTARKVNEQISGEMRPFEEWSQEQKDSLKRCLTLHEIYGYELI